MTPRPDIVALPATATVEEARRTFLESGHSRLPVYRGSVDEIVGVLHVRDLLKVERDDVGTTAAHLAREPTFVPETRSVAALLPEMRLKTQLAVVLDEYGGTAGIVTLEDLVEEIVGEIRDEHDEEEKPLREERDGSWTINAATHVEELEELFGIELGERDFDTVGGLVVSQLGRVPHEGDRLQFQSILIDVLQMDGRRIREVRVQRVEPAGQSRAEG
jgi:magnesium and cobalt transporter